MFTKIDAREIREFYKLSEEEMNEGIFDVLYAAKSDEIAYVIYKDKETEKLYENIGAEWKPKEVIVFTLIKALSTNDDIQSLYLELPDFMIFLKQLQFNTKSIVEELIGEAKAYTPGELRFWMTKRSDMELEELGSFGATIVDYARAELSNRYGENEEDEY